MSLPLPHAKMSVQYVNAATLNDKSAQDREAYINEIINRGGVVKFRNNITGIEKYVKSTELDADGDMTAFKTTGRTTAVCWQALEYTVSEAKPEEYT